MTRSTPPERVPTLTEVVEPGREPVGTVPVAATAPAPAPSGAPVEAEIARRVAAELQVHVDRVLEHRVRAALEPVLQALVTRIVDETRRELASTLRDGMARVVAQEQSRHRDPAGPR